MSSDGQVLTSINANEHNLPSLKDDCFNCYQGLLMVFIFRPRSSFVSVPISLISETTLLWMALNCVEKHSPHLRKGNKTMRRYLESVFFFFFFFFCTFTWSLDNTDLILKRLYLSILFNVRIPNKCYLTMRYRRPVNIKTKE